MPLWLHSWQAPVLPSSADTLVRQASGFSTSAPPPPADTTVPVITHTVDGTLGDNGWYTNDVTLSWTVVDEESEITRPPCEAVPVTEDTSGVTYTCAATSGGGSTSQSVTIKRDATAPIISGEVTGTTGSNGWFTVEPTDYTTNTATNENKRGPAGISASGTQSTRSLSKSCAGGPR